MESGLAGILVILGGVVIVYLLVKLFRHKSCEEEDDTLIMAVGADSISDAQQDTNRFFTLAELKQAEEGKYSWDDTGCVFEINPDGSVTIIGHFDPAELTVDPVQEICGRLDDAGLMEMLPRMWCFHTISSKDGECDAFVVAWNDEMFSLPVCPYTIEEVKMISLIPSSFHRGKSVINSILSKTGGGVLTLMPCNEKEYIFSLGAKACVKRVVGNNITVCISSPAVMGAFGIAVNSRGDKSSRISFAFGDDDDYLCCNMMADNGVCEVQKLLHRSVILPMESATALQHIAKGCMVQSLIHYGYVKNFRLHDMLPYTMSLLLKENGNVINIYDLINESTTIPARQGGGVINTDINKTLSFLIGSNELIEDVVAECGVPYGKVEAFIEIDSEMSVVIIITSDTQDYKINVGEIIG